MPFITARFAVGNKPLLRLSSWVYSLDMDDQGQDGLGSQDLDSVIILGRTRAEWRNLIHQLQIKWETLRTEKESAMLVADVGKIKEIEKEMAIISGSLVASRQVLMNPPFYEET